MKVLFGYVNTTSSFDMPLGIGYLSAMLKRAGHKTGLVDLTWTRKAAIPDTDYDLLAISSTSLEFQDAFDLASLWKEKTGGKPVLMGGCKPTVEPLMSLLNSTIDAICVGEGEEAILEFVDRFERTGDLPTDVRNIWVNKNGTVFKNSLRPLIQDLDTLPFPDWSIFDRRHIELKYPATAILTTRGCPFQCSMCINHYLQKLYVGLGEYTRFRSVDNVFAEIHELTRQYAIQRLFFIDDTFTINQTRLEEFCRRYRKEVDIPFLIMARCNTMTKQLTHELARAGCIYIGFGVESGNETIRNLVLGRGMGEGVIVDAFRWAREEGIRTASYNMIGIPSETRREMFDTIRLNKKIRPDVLQTTLLYPFPKTEIYEMAREAGLLRLKEHDPLGLRDYYRNSIVRIEGMNSRQLYALESCFPLYVHLPRLLWPLVRVFEWMVSKNPKMSWVANVFRKKVLEGSFFREMT